jgi:hypothetical protein
MNNSFSWLVPVRPGYENIMIGDKLNIKEEHKKVAKQIMDLLLPKIKNIRERFILTIAGESDAVKSEIAFVLSEKLFFGSRNKKRQTV